MLPAWLLIRKFLDAWAVCDRNQNRIYNLITGPGLPASPKPPRADLIQLDIANSDSDENLLHAFWSLELAHTIHEEYARDLFTRSEPWETSESFGPAACWLSIDPTFAGHSRLSDRIPKGKRVREAANRHWSLASHLLPLIVTPAAHRDHTIVRAPVVDDLENWLAARVKKKTLRLAVSPVSATAKFVGESRHCPGAAPNPPAAFHLTGIETLVDQKAALLDVLKEADAANIAILVLPELRMSPPLLETARDFLAGRSSETGEKGILLLAAGSWHVVHENGRFRNRCVVLDRHGDEIWRHDKLVEYVVTPENVRNTPGLRELGIGDEGAFEDVEHSLSLPVYDSCLGRIAVAICLDFIATPTRELITKSNAEIFLVPAMTPSTHDFEDFARLLREQRAFTFVANCGVVGAAAPSFWVIPRKKDELRKILPGDSLLILDLKNVQI